MSSRPVFGVRPFGARDARLLLIAYFDPNGIETIPQSIRAWQAHSRHEIQLFNLWPGRPTGLHLPNTMDLSGFDGLIMHPTVSYSPPMLEELDKDLERGIAAFDGIKILMKQDEQVLSGRLAPLVASKRFDIVMTCLPPREQAKVYPSEVTGDAHLLQVLTGYVAPSMRNGMPKGRRDIGVSYRGSLQPLAFGRLGYEKRGIGYAVADALADYPDVVADISSRWEDRLSGDAWTAFLARSKAVLGVESGANIFDFDGTVASLCVDFERRHQGEDRWARQFYVNADAEFLHRFEGNVDYAQISPRHFEAAAAGAAQVLYEGSYSDIFLARRHYMPLRRDLGNLAEVIDFLRDDAAQRRMAERSFEEIILDRRNWYEAFVASADDVIDERLGRKGRKRARPAASTRPTVYVLAAHDPTRDPRIGWFAQSLSRTHDVLVIGTHRARDVGAPPKIETGPDGIKILRIERTAHDAAWIPTARQLKQPMSEARMLLAALVGYCGAPASVLSTHLGADIAVDSELETFREHCAYMINTNSALIAAVENLGMPDLVVGADLDTLFAAVACGEASGCQVVHDAHEYWPFCYVHFQHWEIEFWQDIERRLMAHCAMRISVTPQLASIMGAEYRQPFLSLPNAANLSEGKYDGLEDAFAARLGSDRLRVLFLGNFAVGRGLQSFITAWKHVTTDAQLILQGPSNEYHAELVAYARDLGLDDSRVSFLPPVPEDELIATALKADVGLVPYDPAFFVYRYCCPNKLSQYMAAGLPLLSSPTAFVADIVERENIGFVVPLNAPEEIARVVDQMARSKADLVERGRRSRAVFESQFNWDAFVAPILAEIGTKKTTGATAPNLSWIEQQASELSWSRPAPELSSILFGDTPNRSARNFALASEGASITGASPFSGRPNDADVLLRGGGGYAAAISGSSLPHWFEIDLGQTRVIGSLEIGFFDKQNLPRDFLVVARDHTDDPWRLLVERVDNDDVYLKCRFLPGQARFVRLLALSFGSGQQRLLMRSFRVLESRARDVASDSLAGTEIEEEALRPGRRLFTDASSRAGKNFALASKGASITAASAFNLRPNDADVLLRGVADGYAAAMANSRLPHWFEVDLGQVRTIGSVALSFFDEQNLARDFLVMARRSVTGPWRLLVDKIDNDVVGLHCRFPPGEARFVRLVAIGFGTGQQRLLIRSFDIFEGEVKAAEAGQLAGAEVSEITPRLCRHTLRNITAAERGTRVQASSPFFPHPNDASAILSSDVDAYAAALIGSPLPHWLEIDLGETNAISAIAIDWYSEDDYVTDYVVSGRSVSSQAWMKLVDVRGSDNVCVLHEVECPPLRSIRLTATGFKGQERLLIRRFDVLTPWGSERVSLAASCASDGSAR